MTSFQKQRALALWEEGQRYHLSGELERAIQLYTKSIELFPTAEAYTFRGWAYSFRGDIDNAISECKKAIEVDPSFGNPYNDIGSYLIKLGRESEAITWLEKAKDAPRYQARHFPYMNLGRLYAKRGELAHAIEEFQTALSICPDEATCMILLSRLRAQLN